jgi:hypothetical protein
MERAEDPTQPRTWLYVSFALMALKPAIAPLSVAQRHHAVPVTRTVWITLLTSARRIQSRMPTIAFAIFLVLVIPFYAVVVYAMFHGWKGWQL